MLNSPHKGGNFTSPTRRSSGPTTAGLLAGFFKHERRRCRPLSYNVGLHMRNAESARQSALAFLAAGPFAEAKPVLLDAETQEFNEGWIYFYQSAGFAKTGEISEMLMGNAPVFVPRNGTPPSFISHHRSFLESMEAFRLSGNTEAQAHSQVRLAGCEPGALAVSAIQSIRQHSSLGLAAAKRVIDSCLAGEVQLIDTPSVALARELVSSLSKLGFVAQVTYGWR